MLAMAEEKAGVCVQCVVGAGVCAVKGTKGSKQNGGSSSNPKPNQTNCLFCFLVTSYKASCLGQSSGIGQVIRQVGVVRDGSACVWW